jgi:hypothetical protein
MDPFEKFEMVKCIGKGGFSRPFDGFEVMVIYSTRMYSARANENQDIPNSTLIM